jgi:hypothetical protein
MKFGLFQFEEYAITTPCHVSSLLNITPVTNPLPKFKDNFPKLLGNENISTNEHLVAFSNACHNIGANDHDTCICLFFNSLEARTVIDFFKLPTKVFLIWDELNYWVKSTYGNPKDPTNQFRE